FWTTVAVKKVNDVTRLQALVDKKKVVVTEDTIKDVLRLDDAEGYKAFFSSQWKFLIHTILQCMSAERMSWNEFSSLMASDVICLSSCRKFNFLKYIFDSLVRNVDSPTKFYMVGKGFSGVETLLFERMLVAQEVEEGDADENVENVNAGDTAE
nr:hypothetical protein [Tanacetum cinerariifolium]